MKELEEIKEEMDNLKSIRDIEARHGEADKLLCKLAKVLASRLGADIEKEVEDILKQYDEMERWYA